MADADQVAILKKGVSAWNQWRREHPGVRPDLRNLMFTSTFYWPTGRPMGVHVRKAALFGANLRDADLRGAHLEGGDLGDADLRGAELRDTKLDSVRLDGAIFDERTHWPADFNPEARGAIRQGTEADWQEPVDFTITFDPTLSPEQIRLTLHALADYYRACGGVGFEVDFAFEEIVVKEPVRG
jgi:hypothetical protein